MKGVNVFRCLMPAALAEFLAVPVQTADAMGGGHGMGGGHAMGSGHGMRTGGMGRMGGTGRAGGMGAHGPAGRLATASSSFSRNGVSRFSQRQRPAFRDPASNRFAIRGDRRDQFRG